ncbi:hypothetical protein GGP41_006535 [Bipolaris sorokiniana]|uniref:Secreted protein n=1 Tax=Cochliobolus sativus TaxID=45130 RepID=A0A8H5ZNY3_COCSA|nr:hypothetical protein GGP41_006535 [Bipolaris sorokiniana]
MLPGPIAIHWLLLTVHGRHTTRSLPALDWHLSCSTITPPSTTVWAPDDTDRGMTMAHIHVDASTLDSPNHVRLCKHPCSGSTWVHAVSISYPHYLVPATPHLFPFCQSSLVP